MKNILLKLILVSLFIGFTSCEKDFLNVNSDVRGAKNFNLKSQEFPITAFTKESGSVQANGLETVFLGAFKDDTYNTTTVSNIITELVPEKFNPDLGENPRIDSVHVNIPYFSTLLATAANGSSTYSLNSITGDPTVTYNLKILKSDYLLRDLDPATNFTEPQVYYTDFYSSTIEPLDNTYTVLYDDDFMPSSKQEKLRELDDNGDPIGEPVRLLPSMRIDLFPGNEAFWNDLMGIIENSGSVNTQEPRDYLANANSFKQFFKGLIFKVEVNSPGTGSTIVLNINSNQAGVSIDYKNAAEEVDGFEPDIRNPSQYLLGFNGITVNTHTNSPAINIPNSNNNIQDDALYLRGFEGGFAVVDLFGTEDNNSNGISDAFETFRENKGKWLINEANIKFRVKNSLVNNDEPNRVILYDLNTKQPIVDYFFDLGSNEDASLSRTTFSTPLTKDTSGNGKEYKIRVTEHLNNLLLRDSTNVKLGLYVTNNINNVGFVKMKNPITVGAVQNQIEIDEIPQSSILSDRGTIIHGATNNVAIEDKIKFEVYYTEEN